MTRADLRTVLLARYETSAREYLASVAESETDRDVWLSPSLPPDVVGALDIDGLDNGDPIGYRCRRCLVVHGLDHGSDDMAGLCDDCWCAVDRMRDRWSAA